ncbi:MAG: thioesterase family protein [Rhodospirillaceae bacterium]
MTELRPGLGGSAKTVVGEDHTASRVGSGAIRVLATPVMMNLMEAAALDAMEKHLPAGRQSLGTHLDVSHVAATPVGMHVTAKAEVLEADGNKVTLRVEALDEAGLIGEGTHRRVVVDVARFDARVQDKVKWPGS